MNSKTTTPTAPAMVSVYDGRRCIGFVLPRGKVGFEAFDRDERSCGLFIAQRDAIAALSDMGGAL